MIRNTHQIVREWLETDPGDFTLRQASEATGLSQVAIYRLCTRLGWIEKVGDSDPVRVTNHRTQYTRNVYRRRTP